MKHLGGEVGGGRHGTRQAITETDVGLFAALASTICQREFRRLTARREGKRGYCGGCRGVSGKLFPLSFARGGRTGCNEFLCGALALTLSSLIICLCPSPPVPHIQSSSDESYVICSQTCGSSRSLSATLLHERPPPPSPLAQPNTHSSSPSPWIPSAPTPTFPAVAPEIANRCRHYGCVGRNHSAQTSSGPRQPHPIWSRLRRSSSKHPRLGPAWAGCMLGCFDARRRCEVTLMTLRSRCCLIRCDRPLSTRRGAAWYPDTWW